MCGPKALKVKIEFCKTADCKPMVLLKNDVHHECFSGNFVGQTGWIAPLKDTSLVDLRALIHIFL